MARKRKRKYVRHYDRFADGYSFDLNPEAKKSILIIALVAFGGISLLSLFGVAGFLGNYVNQGLGLLFGWGRAIFPILLLTFGFLLYNEDKKWIHGYTYVGLFFFILSFHALLHIFLKDNPELAASLGRGGGYVGLFLAKIFVSLMGFWASLLLLFCLFIISVVLIFNTTISGLFGEDGFFGKLFSPVRWLLNRGRAEEEDYYDERGNEEGSEDDEAEAGGEEAAEYKEGEGRDMFSSYEVADEKEGAADEDEQAEESKVEVKRSNIKISLPLNLLSDKIGRPSGADVNTTRDIIKRTLENFGILVEMGETKVGPTVTQYTFKPAEGIKLTRITGLSNDLALATAMHPIRIEAPIPGKALVGVEVPNRVIARVGLREILDTPDFKHRKNNTMIALGKDVAGQAWMANLAKMPHLLVAGATGSGKSVCLNTIIVSLLYQNNPDDLKFIMVDPKRVELPVYNGIPYLLTPVITDVPKTINALKWCLNEMDRRFDVLAAAGKRNLESYNAAARERMPYIIFIIDELADLMVAAARDVEAAIVRLSQMARAVGIHLVLATQRPSVDIITGLIKANIPARIAFSVASSVDSRTILDSQGAEKLLGRGDMLFITAELSKPKRIQGAFVSDKEIRNIVRYIKEKSGEVEYDINVVEKQKVGGVAGAGFNDEDGDDLFEEAKEMIVNSGKASTSFLQRRLRVGYARAARLIDLLEESGIIGPANGAKPREILISKSEYAKVSEMGTSGMPLHNREESKFDARTILGEDNDEEDEREEEGEDDEYEAYNEEYDNEGGADEIKKEEPAVIVDAEEQPAGSGSDLPPVIEAEAEEESEDEDEDDENGGDEEMERLYSR